MNRFWFLFKSTAVRLSALYILLFAICAATLVFYVTAMSERLLTGQIRDAVKQEVEQVQRAYDTGGMALSRARLISGDDSLIAEAEHIIREVLTSDRDIAKVAHVQRDRGLSRHL